MKHIIFFIPCLVIFSCNPLKQSSSASSFVVTEHETYTQGQAQLQSSQAKENIDPSVIRPTTNPPVADPIAGLSANPDVNSRILQRFIDSVLPYSNVYLPRGDFSFSKTLVISKPIQVYGSGMNATALHFMKGVAGIKINKAVVTLKDLSIIGYGSNGTPANGLETNSRGTIENVTIRTFSGNAVYVFSAVSEGSNASMCTFRNVFAIECKGSGFFMQGNDSNGMVFYNCNAMDNGGYGFYDHSFLGNQFFACMAHNSAKGNYRADGPVARSTFFGCYSEQQKVKDYLGGVAYWFGGNLGEGGDNYELHNYAKVFAD